MRRPIGRLLPAASYVTLQNVRSSSSSVLIWSGAEVAEPPSRSLHSPSTSLFFPRTAFHLSSAWVAMIWGLRLRVLHTRRGVLLYSSKTLLLLQNIPQLQVRSPESTSIKSSSSIPIFVCKQTKRITLDLSVTFHSFRFDKSQSIKHPHCITARCFYCWWFLTLQPTFRLAR